MHSTADIMQLGNNNDLVRLAGGALLGGNNALAMASVGYDPEFFATRRRLEVLSNVSQFPAHVQEGLKNGSMFSKDYMIQSPRELGKSDTSWTMLKRDDQEIDYMRNINGGRFEHEDLVLITHFSLKYYQGAEMGDFSRTKFPEKLLGFGELVFKIEENEAVKLPLSSCYEPKEDRDFDEMNIIFELQKPIIVLKNQRINLDLKFANALGVDASGTNAKHWILAQLHGSAVKKKV